MVCCVLSAPANARAEVVAQLPAQPRGGPSLSIPSQAAHSAGAVRGQVVMLHSDLFRASQLVPRTVDRALMLDSHRIFSKVWAFACSW